MSRGIGQHAGGAYSGDCQQDLIDTDPYQGPITVLSGSADAITNHVGGNYLINRAGVDAITLFQPIAGADDGLTLVFVSNTANAHTITCPTTCIQTGGASALKTVVTLTANLGASVQLRAYQGNWQAVGQVGVTSFT
jgi:hypothetical protein